MLIDNQDSIENKDIDDAVVEEMALDMGLVSMDEAEYPSIAEMEIRIQEYNAGEAFVDVALRLGVALCIVIAVLALGLTLYKLWFNKERLKRALIPIGILVVVLLIGMLNADTSTEGLLTDTAVSEGELKLVGTLINTTLILTYGGVLTLVVLKIKALLKND